MKVLFDECFPSGLRNEYSEHEVLTVYDMQWQGKKNGDLLTLAVENRFEVFVTIDKNLKYQLNTKKYRIGIIVLDIIKTKIEFIKPLKEEILRSISKIKPYEVIEIKQRKS